ncbi:hypothetical protein RSSM_05707 [Rhodopirellula sallentina SM41]|uniref:Uncharacterized protein n=1 Tax=Rhodopirellula sallentina SM41 TaxID=1263870 RepID=M5UA49_9BACT|nr:hypothetical protein RSSM_05707 [Rhodopirellula sallentina SM41]
MRDDRVSRDGACAFPNDLYVSELPVWFRMTCVFPDERGLAAGR